MISSNFLSETIFSFNQTDILLNIAKVLNVGWFSLPNLIKME